METRNIHPVTRYIDNNTLSSNKDVPIKKNDVNKNTVPSEAPKTDNPFKKTSLPIKHHHIGTKVAFSIEKDLHIVVTTVKDANTNKVIRQIPPEETIDRLKLLSTYNKQPISNAVKFQSKYYIVKDF